MRRAKESDGAGGCNRQWGLAKPQQTTFQRQEQKSKDLHMHSALCPLQQTTFNRQEQKSEDLHMHSALCPLSYIILPAQYKVEEQRIDKLVQIWRFSSISSHSTYAIQSAPNLVRRVLTNLCRCVVTRVSLCPALIEQPKPTTCPDCVS